MNDWKWAITLASCCCIVLTIAPSASADFLGVTTVIKDDPDTEFLCTQGFGAFVAGPLTVCNVYAIFDNPDDVLLSVGNTDLQVYIGQNPDLFFRHPSNALGTVTAPSCTSVGLVPDLICDTFVTIGWKCTPDPTQENPSPDNTATSLWNNFAFVFNGHIIGGWFNSSPSNGQGDAGTWPDLHVLFLQSSVAKGLSLSGDIDIFWVETYLEGDTVAELDVPIECVATCGSCPTDVDGNGQVEAFDLANLLGKWGPVTSAGVCLDADGNGLIEAFDLAVLLGAWGPCL